MKAESRQRIVEWLPILYIYIPVFLAWHSYGLEGAMMYLMGVVCVYTSFMLEELFWRWGFTEKPSHIANDKHKPDHPNKSNQNVDPQSSSDVV